MLRADKTLGLGAVRDESDRASSARAAASASSRRGRMAATGSRGRDSERKMAARSEERRQFSTELGHITKELTNQLGGLVRGDLSAVARKPAGKAAAARLAHAPTGDISVKSSSSSSTEVASLVEAASSQGGGQDKAAARSARQGGVVDHGARQRGGHRNVEARKAAEVMRLQEQRAAAKAKKRQTAAAEAKAALLRMVKKAAVKPKPFKVKVSKSVRKAETLVDDNKGKEVCCFLLGCGCVPSYARRARPPDAREHACGVWGVGGVGRSRYR